MPRQPAQEQQRHVAFRGPLFLRINGQAFANSLELRINGGRERFVISKLTENVGSMVTQVREIEACEFTPELIRCVVISQRCFLCGFECAEPETGTVLREPYLSDPLPPMPLSHPAVELRGFHRSANALHGNGLFWGEEAWRVLLLLLLLVEDVELGLDLKDL